jgi:hypothetical protein
MYRTRGHKACFGFPFDLIFFDLFARRQEKRSLEGIKKPLKIKGSLQEK